MKAIYINLDPYLQAVADWLNAGKPGTVPSFQPLPVAVTIPLGESACIYCAGKGNREEEADSDGFSIDGKTLYFYTATTGDFSDGIPADAIDVNVVPGLSALAPTQKYFVVAVAGDTIGVPVLITDIDEISDTPVIFTVPVLVRREQAQGPVDLVDFTPPATLTAAQINTALGGTGAAEGQPLKGVSLSNATNAPAPTANAINEALGGDGAEEGHPLNGVDLGGAIINVEPEGPKTRIFDGNEGINVDFGDTMLRYLGSTSES